MQLSRVAPPVKGRGMYNPTFGSQAANYAACGATGSLGGANMKRNLRSPPQHTNDVVSTTDSVVRDGETNLAKLRVMGIDDSDTVCTLLDPFAPEDKCSKLSAENDLLSDVVGILLLKNGKITTAEESPLGAFTNRTGLMTPAYRRQITVRGMGGHWILLDSLSEASTALDLYLTVSKMIGVHCQDRLCLTFHGQQIHLTDMSMSKYLPLCPVVIELGWRLCGSGGKRSEPEETENSRETTRRSMRVRRLAPVVHGGPSLGAFIQIYAMGRSIPAEDQGDMLMRLGEFHANPDVQTTCRKILRNAAEFLEVTEVHGRLGTYPGHSAKQDIPSGTPLAAYFGVLEKSSHARSDYLLELGQLDADYSIVINGEPSDERGWPSLGQMALLNHACPPRDTCSIDHIACPSGLVFFFVCTTNLIQAGQQVTFNYQRQVSQNSFWTSRCSSHRRPAGRILIECDCAFPARCPNSYVRYDLRLASSSRKGMTDARTSPVLPHSQGGRQAAIRSFLVPREHITNSLEHTSHLSGRTTSQLHNLEATGKSVHGKCPLGYSARDAPPDSAGPALGLLCPEEVERLANHNKRDQDLDSNGPLAMTPERTQQPGDGGSVGSVLFFTALAGPRAPAEGCNVAAEPYGSLHGPAYPTWRGQCHPICIRDQVRAARGEGSCFLLCILTSILEAESLPEFAERRSAHPELQGDFAERWKLLLALAEDRNASGLRTILHHHLLTHVDRFQPMFNTELPLSDEQWATLTRLERQAGVHFSSPSRSDPLTPLRTWAFQFLRSSTHVDERFMHVLLDWLQNKLAIITLVQVQNEMTGQLQFLHVTAHDLIPDTAVLLVKVLNIERGPSNREALNHFDLVCNQCPVAFLSDTLNPDRKVARHTRTSPDGVSSERLPLDNELTDDPGGRLGRDLTSIDDCSQDFAKRTSMATDLGNPKPTGRHRQTSSSSGDTVEPQVPSTVAEAEHLLRSFDVAPSWGPAQSLTRAERLRRLRTFQTDPPGWAWVDSILTKYPELASVRPSHRVSGIAQPSSTERPPAPCPRTRNAACTEQREPDCLATGGIRRHSWKRLAEIGDHGQTAYAHSSAVAQEASQEADGRGCLLSSQSPGATQFQELQNDLAPEAQLGQFATAPSQEGAPLETNRAPRDSVEAGLFTTLRLDQSRSKSLSDGQESGLQYDENMSRHLEVDATQQRGTSHSVEPERREPENTEVLIPPAPTLAGLLPWVPGTSALYPRVLRSNDMADFSIWDVRIPGMRWQQAMFHAADRVTPSAFYVSADIWSKGKKGWKLGKIFGAFRDVEGFVRLLLSPAPTRCFYEIIREERACKAYFDAEAEPGAMNAEEGQIMCHRLVVAWAARIRQKWPQAEQQCPRCLEVVILDGSRQTRRGWKVSYHLVYPWLTFPCNNTVLKEEVTAISNQPQFQYSTENGTMRSFVDSAVYSRNRQIRLPLSYKLSDETCTPLRLPFRPVVSLFGLACITRLESDAWLVPREVMASVQSSARPWQQGARSAKMSTLLRPQQAPPVTPDNSAPNLIASVTSLLRQSGQPDGRLQPMPNPSFGTSFRWMVTAGDARQCSVAQIWRPSNPTHDSNGAIVSVHASGAVFLKCLHPECLRLSAGPGTFLGFASNRDTAGRLSEANELSSHIPTLTAPRPLSVGSSWLHHSLGKKQVTRPVSGPNQPEQQSRTSGIVNDHSGSSVSIGHLLPVDMDPPPSDPGVPLSPLTREQGVRKLYLRNQIDDEGPLDTWNVVNGPYGGRTGIAPSAKHPTADPVRGQDGDSGQDFAAVSEWSERSPFSAPAPDALVTAICTSLNADNTQHAAAQQGTLEGWSAISQTVSATVPSPAPGPAAAANFKWEIGPPREWFAQPLGARTAVGQDLVSKAILTTRQGVASPPPSAQDPADLWDSPFLIGFLSVGFRRLQSSIPGIIGYLERHRPDVLFLGDLGTKRNKIGRLRLQVEADLGEEWFLLSDIRDTAGYPVGMGVLIHASAAKLVAPVSLQCPQGSDKDQWEQAVGGRLICLKLSQPGAGNPLYVVGLNQHVAAGSTSTARSLLLGTVEQLTQQVKDSGGRILILGDMNAAPDGGRWGYSRRTRTRAADDCTSTWASRNCLQEIKSTPLRATWRACLLQRKAVLDRAWIYPADIPDTSLTIHWNTTEPVFDHALIMVRLPKSMAGTGYAGACRPLQSSFPLKRCRVDLKKFRATPVLQEWGRLVDIGLAEDAVEPDGPPPDPFQALKHGEILADSIAYALAPKRERRKGEVRRSFGFGGHRAIFREVNLLQQARIFVKNILTRNSEVIGCPHRCIRWQQLFSRLHAQLSRSVFMCPQPLSQPAVWYLTPPAERTLKGWMDQAKQALNVRMAAVRESFAKARFSNVQQLCSRLKRNGGVLDARTIQAVLGKRLPRQRMWGISGAAPLGISLTVSDTQHPLVLAHIQTLSAAVEIVRILADSTTLQIWLRGPRALGDLLSQWCRDDHAWSNTPICIIPSSQPYVAIIPDDMLAVQELHMAREGMDSGSICLRCKARGIQAIVASASLQPCGNPQRAVRFFCGSCRTVSDHVDLAPLPPCPIPWAVWRDMQKIPSTSVPLVSREIDFDTLETCARRMPCDKSPGSDGIPREYYKYGPTVLLQRLRTAINAYISGQPPSVDAHEWNGGIVSLIAKVPSALSISDYRPVVRICSKFIIATTIFNDRLTQAVEEFNLLDDAQEGFRRHRSTKRQLSKLHGLLSDHRKRRKCLSVVLYLDIKNAFNAVDHRPIFAILTAYGFPAEDVALFRRMYSSKFLCVGNPFGRTAACFLARGFPQGDPPSATMFIMVYDPFHKIVRACRRGCSTPAWPLPSGSSGFADDSNMHTAGPDAIPAMQVLVSAVSPFLVWLGLLVNMTKSFISAFDFGTGKVVATDSVTLHGSPFLVLEPNQAHKHLGVRMTIMGDFTAEKNHVQGEMQRRLDALLGNEALLPSVKEMVIMLGVVSVFRYSAGVVPWSRSELEEIYNMWIRAYKQIWFGRAGRSADSSPMVLDLLAGGRNCPSPTEIWIRDVLDLHDQCLALPGEIAQLVTCNLQQTCLDHGCTALSQLQGILRIGGRADPDSILELLLARLDEQGLQVSSPWTPRTGESIATALWPQLWNAWRTRQDWNGCKERDDSVQQSWAQAKHCLSALRHLGQAGVLTLPQLQDPAGNWIPRHMLSHTLISEPEYVALTTWLQHVPAQMEAVATAPTAGGDATASRHAATRDMDVNTGVAQTCQGGLFPQMFDQTKLALIPPCILGTAQSVVSHDRVLLKHRPVVRCPNDPLDAITDSQLADELCRSRAVFPFKLGGNQLVNVECLAPLRSICAQALGAVRVIVQNLDASQLANQFAVLAITLVRACLQDRNIYKVADACTRPSWPVPRMELCSWFDLRDHWNPCPQSPQWRMSSARSDGQRVLIGMVQGFRLRRDTPLLNTPSPLHPWQTDPQLPPSVKIDLSNHHPRQLPSPSGWDVRQRNARILIEDLHHRVSGLDAAHYGMLIGLQGSTAVPTTQHLQAIQSSYLAQRQADLEYHVPWSRHLLACLHHALALDLLVGARAVNFNPHFQYYASPDQADTALGAVHQWPTVPALLLLDSYPPPARQGVLQQASNHPAAVWVLRYDHPSRQASTDLSILRTLGARLCAALDPACLVHHDSRCWSEARWDTVPARYASQLWLLPGLQGAVWQTAQNQSIQHSLGDWTTRRYDFYYPRGCMSTHLRLYRAHQQDSLLFSWQGLVAGTDGSVHYGTERMGAGLVVTEGLGSEIILELSAPVGGPLASLRSEAASLLSLLHSVRLKRDVTTQLLILVDCLALLLILLKWGRADFWPGPRDVIHFDIILPLLQELYAWQGVVVLLKVKSHAGCMHNEMADERAEAGCFSDEPQLFPGPHKYGCLHLRIKSSLRDSVQQERVCDDLPRDGAPNKTILRRVISVNTLRAIKSRHTIFVRDLLQRAEGKIAAHLIDSCGDSVVRCWMKMMMGTYPVTSYLHRIGKAASAVCQHCNTQAVETLTHFLSICPGFHDARTAAHNRIRQALAGSLRKVLPSHWQLHEETPMSATGLELQPVPSALMIQAGRLLSTSIAPDEDIIPSRWQPDFMAVSPQNKKIGIIDLCRPSDGYSQQLTEAYERKIRTYGPLQAALGLYSNTGWQVEILPWVVGARGLIQEQRMHRMLDFLEIPTGKWKLVVHETIKATLYALHFMHKLRFSSNTRQVSDVHVPNTTPAGADHSLAGGRKRKVRPGDEDLSTVQQRWKRMTTAARREHRGTISLRMRARTG